MVSYSVQMKGSLGDTCRTDHGTPTCSTVAPQEGHECTPYVETTDTLDSMPSLGPIETLSELGPVDLVRPWRFETLDSLPEADSVTGPWRLETLDSLPEADCVHWRLETVDSLPEADSVTTPLRDIGTACLGQTTSRGSLLEEVEATPVADLSVKRKPHRRECKQWGIQAMATYGYTLHEFHGDYGVRPFRRATNKRTGEDVAVFFGDVSNDEQKKTALLNEFTMLNRVRHPNIVGLELLVETKYDMWLCLEWCTVGSLQSFIEKYGCLETQAAARYGTQLLSAVEYLHRRRNVHCDIMPEGIFLQTGAVLKVANFGRAQGLDAQDRIKALPPRSVGDRSYHAPELLAGLACDAKVDVWSSTLCIFYMMCGQLPFNGKQVETFVSNPSGRVVPDNALWQKLPEQVKHTLLAGLTIQSERRPTAFDFERQVWKLC
eukprot:TRINITY_DN40589_c0_g1_i1.p1 TRINITY_DN40589_c0_g1~~TRINITY_DN40589_c0_g1_i1.p1  ORF type:complete len:434 (+),score=71.63 TRINITY_DN40589_c0_g1_i1:206-1507(+)